MSSGSYPGPFHGDVQMPLNEGTKDRHALRGPRRELSYSKHAPAPWPGERSHTQENSKLRKSQGWSHTPTKGTPWLINTTAQLCPDCLPWQPEKPLPQEGPKVQSRGSQPGACPLLTVTRGDSSSTERTNHSPKFQTKELNTDTATLRGATSCCSHKPEPSVQPGQLTHVHAPSVGLPSSSRAPRGGIGGHSVLGQAEPRPAALAVPA